MAFDDDDFQGTETPSPTEAPQDIGADESAQASDSTRESPEPSGPPKPSGKSIRELLQAEFDKARLEPAAPKAPSPARQKAAETRDRDQATGKFLASEAPKAAPAPIQEAKPEAKVEPPVQEGLKPPPGWSPEARAAFSSLPAAVQQAISKRENEVSDGFKSKSDELKSFQDRAKEWQAIEEVLAPHQAIFRANGRSNADVIRQLLGWMTVLGNNDPNVRRNGFKQLASSFNVDINQLAPAAPQPAAEAIPPTDATGSQPQNGFDLNAVQRLIQEAVNQSVTPIREQISNQSQQTINEHIAQWAADKPYYQKVRMMMGGLIQAGQVPILSNGKPDLDQAYQMAIYAQPEVRAEILKAEEEKRQAEANQKAEEARLAAEKEAAEKKRAEEEAKALAEKDKQEKLASARKASASIRGMSPVNEAPQRPNQPRKRMSVRESIMAAIEEHRA
jgi:hypothetical protein